MSRSLYARLRRRFGTNRSRSSRREFLRAGVAASTGLLLTGCAGGGRGGASRPDVDRRVAVIGAGFAGLACAHELASAGYDVRVFEARERLGGRVLSFGDFLPERNVEGGGEFIGSNHPLWNAYAERFGLELLEATEDEHLETPVVMNGRRLSSEQVEALYEEMDGAFAALTEAAAPIDADRPWLSPQAGQLDRRTTAQWIDGLEVSPLCKHALRTELTANNGVLTQRQSYLANLAQVKGGGLDRYWEESETYRCKGGNQQLAQRLAEAVGERRVRLGTPVAAVDLRENGATVTTAGNDRWEADHVVLAVPPSVWHRIAIAPALPSVLMPQMGNSVKFLMGTRDRFWRGLGLSPDSFTDGDVQMTWEGTDNQPGDANACLIAFSSGPAAERNRGGTDFTRAGQYLYELSRIYPGLRDRVVDQRFMDWPAAEWTGAGYSFPAPGQVTRMGPMLEKGFGRLHFAGEHCSYAFIGYMEGALQSGAAAARRIAEKDGVATPTTVPVGV